LLKGDGEEEEEEEEEEELAFNQNLIGIAVDYCI